MRSKYNLSWLLTIAILLSGCITRQEYSEEEMQVLVDEALELKLIDYWTTKIRRCEEALLQAAQEAVDSILFLESQTDIDSSLVPAFIPKPARPEIKVIPDTRPILPLFDSIDAIDPDTIKE
ncbi:MAG: hypothetical protein AAF242_14380 [Bacteroidota bacterium]